MVKTPLSKNRLKTSLSKSPSSFLLNPLTKLFEDGEDLLRSENSLCFWQSTAVVLLSRLFLETQNRAKDFLTILPNNSYKQTNKRSKFIVVLLIHHPQAFSNILNSGFKSSSSSPSWVFRFPVFMISHGFSHAFTSSVCSCPQKLRGFFSAAATGEDIGMCRKQNASNHIVDW